MTKYTFNFDSRKPIDPSTIKDGDIVAFEWYCEYEETTKKGVACMETSDFFYAAYNLFRDADDEGGVWVSDELPENITLYAPTKEEFELAIGLFSSYNINYLNYINQDSPKNIEKLKTTLREREDRMEKVVELLNAKAQQQSKEIEDLSHRLFEEGLEYNTKLSDAQKEIDQLKATIAEMEKKPSEDDFVKRFVRETKHFFKHDRKKADIIRQIMIKVGRVDADADIDAWIEGAEKPIVKIENAADVIAEGGKKIVKHINEAV